MLDLEHFNAEVQHSLKKQCHFYGNANNSASLIVKEILIFGMTG